MRTTKSPNLELIGKRKIKGWGHIILIVLEMSIF
jgi:hypothetical protein